MFDEGVSTIFEMLQRRPRPMLYPRKDKTGKIVTEDEMVGVREHLSTQHRIINLIGEIGWELDSTNLLLALDSMSKEPVKVIISSPGGMLDTAFLIYDTFKLVKSPIYTLGTYCASAAALILAAGTKRYLMPHAKIMLHLPSMGFHGDSKDFDIQHKEMETYKNKMIELLRECGAKKSHGEILKDIDREKWMSPEETIDYGLADEIIMKETMQEWLMSEVTK